MLRKNFPERKKARRDAAVARQAEYDKLSPEAKALRLPDDGATKQRRRLGFTNG